MKVFIVHASYGEGHKRAAQALEGVVGGKCFDLLDFCHPWIKTHTAKAYLDMTQGKGKFWSLLFNFSKYKLTRKFLDWFCGVVFYAFIRYLRYERPDVVVVTHPFAAPLLMELKKEWDFKIIVVVTDIKVHPWWIYKGVDHYFAALEETRNDLVAQGVEANKISCGFVPIRQGFWQAQDAGALRNKFGIDNRPAILFVSSIRGKFPFLKTVLERLSQKYNLLVVCGRNEKFKQQIEELRLPSVKAFGFYENIWELSAVSFLLVTKPGGLTIFEGLAQKKFFLLTHFIPGQEKENMNILIHKKIGAYPRTPEAFLRMVDYFAHCDNETSGSYPVIVRDIRLPMENLIKSFCA